MDYSQLPDNLETKEAKTVDTVEIKEALDSHSKALEEFVKKTDEQLAALKKKVEDPLLEEEVKKITTTLQEEKAKVEALRLAEARPPLDPGQRKYSAEELEHKRGFEGYFRKGNDTNLRELEQKALSVGTDPDGGYTVPVQMEAAIDRVITEISPIRQIARVVNVSSASYKKMVSQGGATSGWVGEQTSRPETNTPTLSTLEYPVMEMYANPAATQSILDDSAINIETWLAEEVAVEFAQQEGNAYVNGDGANKPQGFLSYPKIANDSWSWGNVGYVATGVSGDWADSSSDPGAEITNIVDLVYALKPAFRGNARFVANRTTIANVMKLRDADGRQLWSSGLREGEPDRLMSYPIMEDEEMPAIAADSYSLAFGDFRRGYIIVDRIGVRVLRDPYSSKPYIQFYTTKRTGGGIGHFEAIKLLKYGTS